MSHEISKGMNLREMRQVELSKPREFRKEEQSRTEDRKRRPAERKGTECCIALSSVLKKFTGFHVENENLPVHG